MAAKPEEPLVTCLIAHVSTVDGQVVRGGALLRGDDPRVRKNPSYFARTDLSDLEMAEAKRAAWGRVGLPVPVR